MWLLGSKETPQEWSLQLEGKVWGVRYRVVGYTMLGTYCRIQNVGYGVYSGLKCLAQCQGPVWEAVGSPHIPIRSVGHDVPGWRCSGPRGGSTARGMSWSLA